MKKILALVLAAILALVAVSALAEESKVNEDISDASTNLEGVTMEKAEDTDETTAIKEALKEAQKNGDVLAGLPEEIRNQIPEGRAVINEMDTYQLEGYTGQTADKIILTFKFETPYEEGEDVTVLFAITAAEKETEWLVRDGKGNAEGAVEVEVTEEQFVKLTENPFVVIPVSA